MSTLPPRRLPPGASTGGFLSFVALGLSVFLLGFVMWSRGDFGFGSSDAQPHVVTARGDLAADEQATIEIFEQASRSVVNVSQVMRVLSNPYQGTFEEDATDTGTGFVWDEDGHIVTNAHVILVTDPRTGALRLASGFQVTLPDQRTYDAELVGMATNKDLAVLRIQAPPSRLHALAVGTSHDLRVGQKVLAIGNPYGLDHTLTTGVISALDRTIRSPTEHPIYGVVQTDAAINPGNSGGPLLDSAGRLIGVNTMIFSRTGSSAGIGFAVPVDVVNEVVPELIAHGKVVRPGLGVQLDSRDHIARAFGLEGAHVLTVEPGTAAERAGLRGVQRTRRGDVRGDIILRIDDVRTRSRLDVLDALADRKVGDTIPVVVDREGEVLTLDVTLQSLD